MNVIVLERYTVYDLYLNVLKTKKIESGVNTGIRLIVLNHYISYTTYTYFL